MEILVEGKRDFLTGFYTKEELKPVMEKVRAECGRENQPFSILIIDIDHFKSYNDKYGHADGDILLRHFSSNIRDGLFGAKYAVIRFGGDEFIIILPERSSADACQIGIDLAKALDKRPYVTLDRRFALNFSGGVASYPDDGTDIDELFNKADRAMYFSKSNGRKKVTIYGRMKGGRFASFALLAVLAALIVAAAVFTQPRLQSYLGKAVNAINHFGNAIHNPVKKIPDKDSVYLVSGGVFRGEIIKETDSEIVMKLSISKGEGTTAIPKSKIKSIDRGRSR